MAMRVAVLGAGPGGYVAAVRAAQMGAQVTVIEEDNVGGTCLNWGCIPSKVLITTAELLEKCHKAKAYGIDIDGTPSLNMAALMARKQSVIQAQTKGILGLFKHHNVEYVRGRGRIEGAGRITVSSGEGGNVDVPWDRLIIATGTRPFDIPAFPFDGNKILSSNHALSLESIPESILIVGGGVIGCEFAFILSALGAKVTVVEALDRLLPLPSVDEECSKVLQREMKKRKIKFIVNKTVDSVDEADGKLRVSIGVSPFLDNPSEKDKKPLVEEVEKMLVCIGRSANSREIGLDTIGLETDDRGWIATDDRMLTSVDNVYAIGDILGPPKIMLAHVASTEGLVAADNIMGETKTMDYSAVPGAIFTMPEVANVGLTQAQAVDQGFNVKAESVLFRTIGKAQVIGEIAGQAKIVSDADSKRVLGVHIIGPHATDLIAEGTLAVKQQATVEDIANTIHAHPTLAEAMLETSLKSLGRALHG